MKETPNLDLFATGALSTENTVSTAGYEAFVEKFKPKLTTDDCFTPQPVYDAVADWVSAEYGLDKGAFVRPFFPGGDYENHEYPEGAVVVDNPPFSIFAGIVRFYVRRGIRFFLFAPHLTSLGAAFAGNACMIPTAAKIIYTNGADVNTSFVTNLEPDCALRTAPGLYAAIEGAVKASRNPNGVAPPKFEYPENVITAARCHPLARAGVEFRVPRSHALLVRTLDAQRAHGKAIFGAGLLVSDFVRAERERAERERAERERAERERAEREDVMKWQLSKREKEYVRLLNARAEKNNKENTAGA